MEKKKFKLGLLPKLLIAIVLGIIIGLAAVITLVTLVSASSSRCGSAGSSSRHPASSARS